MESTFEVNESKLRRALALDLPYPERPPQKSGTPASVLVLIAESSAGGHSLLLTRRTERVETHKGQMAFPGGMAEVQDSDSAVTALRETEEEVGLSRALVQVIGDLPPLWTVTGFWVTPVVAVLKPKLEEVVIQPNPEEIAEAFWVPLRELLHPGTYRREFREFGSVRYPIHVYQVGEYRIWGATGSMIKNFLDRLTQVS